MISLSERPSKFQRKCIEATERRMDAVGLKVVFDYFEGNTESYYKATTKTDARALEMFVYTDEAGFMINGTEWHVFEKPDYPNEEELIGRFLADLGRFLPQHR